MYKHGKNFKIIDEHSVFIDDSVTFGDDVTVYENNRIEGNTVVGDGCAILPNNRIKNCVIGKGATIEFSHAEDAEIGNNVSVGPFARLRPNAKVLDNAKIGNFVEIKNAVVGKNTKVSHLAYVGDCELGENCNIGCGAIFVNYDGKKKHKTVVGDNCFIGSNCNVIAPVTIESDSYICAGTTVTEDVFKDDFIIGRPRQVRKAGRAHNYLKGGK